MGRKDVATYDVFISYRRDGGSETAKHLRDVLTERGYRVFFDTDSMRSGNFNRKLFDVIEHCKDFIIILSPGALDRCVQEGDWVRLELSYALEHGKNVVPVLSGGFKFPETLPDDINDIRWQNGVAVNIEFFDAMIDKLVSFMHSKPVNRKRKIVIAVVAVCAVLLAGALCFFIFGNGGSGAGSSESSQQASSNVTTSRSSDGAGESNAKQQKTIEPYTLADSVEVYGVDSHRHEYDFSVDGVHILPEEMKYEMWEEYDDETTALLGVQCSLDNFGYGRGSEGKAQPYQIAQDNTVVVKDEDGYMLRVVTEMYHGTDGAYSCESTTSIPSGSKGRFCLIFFVSKDASEVTLSIDSHNGTVYETPIVL
jgi:hypothetical protein